MRTWIRALLIVGGLTSPAVAQTPAWIFSPGAVLQRDQPIPVWGSADPGENVRVALVGAAGDTVAVDKTVTDQTGQWLVRLPAMGAGGPFVLVISGKKTVTLGDILIGDVFICSGQSNMEWALKLTDSAQAFIASSAIDGLRLLTVPRDGANAPLRAIRKWARWVPSGPTTTPEFSAVAYHFGKQLRKDLGVPIGLIHSSVGGTLAEYWTARPFLEAVASLRPIVARGDSAAAKFPAQFAEYQKKLAEWYATSMEADRRAEPIGTPPSFPWDPRTAIGRPSSLYNAMIAPIQPYPVRGVLWYQGEFNSDRAFQYRDLLPAMIESWRQAWNREDLPFLIVQLPNLTTRRAEGPNDASDWAELREAQYLTTRKVPNTALAVTIDVGGDLHPSDKLTVGQRLALLARALIYGERGIVSAGPVYKSMRVVGKTIRLAFDHVGGGLVAKGGELGGFAIAAGDGKFVWADAVIDGDEVVVSSPDVERPVAVRYAWATDPVATLFNAEGLPAMPFRTDSWPGSTDSKR